MKKGSKAAQAASKRMKELHCDPGFKTRWRRSTQSGTMKYWADAKNRATHSKKMKECMRDRFKKPGGRRAHRIATALKGLPKLKRMIEEKLKERGLSKAIRDNLKFEIDQINKAIEMRLKALEKREAKEAKLKKRIYDLDTALVEL